MYPRTVGMHPRTVGLTAGAAALVVALTSTAPAVAASQDVPPPSGKVLINSVHAQGSGCSPDDAAVFVDHGKRSLSLGHDNLYANAGPTSVPEAAERDCTLTFAVNVPAGYTFAFDTVEGRGSSALASGTSGKHTVTYGLTNADAPLTTMGTGEMRGPRGGPHSFMHRPAPEALVYAPCGVPAEITVQTTVAIEFRNKDVESIVAANPHFQEPGLRMNLVWKQCDTH